jgi:hypothetical protein
MLASGVELADAVREAQEYTWQTLRTRIARAWANGCPIDCSGRARDEPAAADAPATDSAADARGSH